MRGIVEEIKVCLNESSQELESARSYVKKHIEDTVANVHRHHFHLMPEVGWMNDPNGFSVYNNEYHLFYQYYPYDVKWGPMHWGHAKSNDLIAWEYLPVALAPDQTYDCEGCFSGSAIQVEDKHILMYTGVHVSKEKDKDVSRQIQCIAIGDGVQYHKIEKNPVIDTHQIPTESSLADFRDPKIWIKDRVFYCVVGSRDADHSGKVLLYKSPNLTSWTYVGVLDHSKHELGKMWECPDLFELDEKNVLLMSPQQLHDDPYKYKNGNTATYFIGDFDYKTAKFKKLSVDEIDYGLDFYAPQTTLSPDGRRIMIAWMQSWDRNIPSDKYGWVGAMSLPRELKIINHKLYQFPIKEIENYRQDRVSYESEILQGCKAYDNVKGRQLELSIGIELKEATEFTIHLMKGLESDTIVKFDKVESTLLFDRSNSQSEIDGLNWRKMPIELTEDKLKLRIFIDTYSVEIFAQDGEYTMTSTVYSPLECEGIEFESNGLCELAIEKWSLKK